MTSCLFCKILKKEIPSTSVYEDGAWYGFLDIAPKAPFHAVFVPREHFGSALEINERREAAVGHLARAAAKVAMQKGFAEGGFRLVMNAGADAGQTVFHLHMHLLGGGALGGMA